MSGTARYLFDTDFRDDRRAPKVSEADLSAAREEGYARGLAEGEAKARATLQAELASVAALLSRQAEMLFADADARAAAVELAAVRLAVEAARKLAGEALADRPLAGLEAAARACLAHARSAPHLAVRVDASLVEAVDGLFARLTRENGYAGRVVVLGDPGVAPGDARIEWADGGLVLEAAARQRALATALGQDTQLLDVDQAVPQQAAPHHPTSFAELQGEVAEIAAEMLGPLRRAGDAPAGGPFSEGKA